MAYLTLRNNTYYYHRRVPSELSQFYEKSVIKFSLKTTVHKKAVLIARQLTAQFDDEFSKLESKLVGRFATQLNRYVVGTKRSRFSGTTSQKRVSKKVVRLSTLANEFIQAKTMDGVSSKAVARYKTHLDLLIAILKDKNVEKLCRQDALDLKAILVKLPPNITRNPKYKDLTYKQISELGDKPRGAHSINDTLKTISGFMDWCVLNEKLPRNSFTKLGVKHTVKPSDQRSAFTKEDLKKIFSVDVFQQEPKETWHKWVPLLGLYTGARINEICQLYSSDIRLVEGIWCIHIGTDYPDQRLKTQSAYRTIPIHSKLIEAGFIEFAQSLRGHLIPTLTYLETDGYGKYPSKWFSVQRDKALTPSERERKTFHSIRHTVATELKRAGVDYHLAAAILGHHNETMTYGRYGKEYSVFQLLETINALTFELPIRLTFQSDK